MVYQDCHAALNPVLRIGDQIDEAVQRRPELVTRSVRDRTLELLEKVRIPSPPEIVDRYPHQLSGGQQQRAVIAMALAPDPDLLILDEPTSNLDVTTEAQILDLVVELKRSVNAGVLFITHNLAVIAHVADRVGVMYAGELFEIGPVHDIFRRPSAPYTCGLLACMPRVDPLRLSHSPQTTRKLRLQTIPGCVPSAAEYPPGCSFAPRCPFARQQCSKRHPELDATPEAGHLARCFFIPRVREEGWPRQRKVAAQSAPASAAQKPVLAGKRLTKTFGADSRKYWLFGPQLHGAIQAIRDISFELKAGETLGVVGESGCGKSTLVRCLSGLERCTSGSTLVAGEEVAADVKLRPRSTLQRMQMVFQNPHVSLNPQRSVGQIIDRAVQTLGGVSSRQERAQRVATLLQRVGLDEEYVERHPAELSGGQQQRVAVARALAGNPEVVLADEVTSSLDVSVRAAILNLLNDLQAEESIAYVFVSHDMSAIVYMSDWVMVLYLGAIMELGPVESVFAPPYHPYTEALISAIPDPDPDVKRPAIRLEGSVPSGRRRMRGCPFHTRCPRKIGKICETRRPPWQQAGENHHIFCHIPLEELRQVVVGQVTRVHEQPGRRSGA